jgi:hypothetical protein
MTVKKSNWSAGAFGKHVSPEMVEDRFLDTEIVILLQGTNVFGDKIYSYVQLVGRTLKEMFTVMQAGDNFKPSDFGTVLAAGQGEPTAQVRQEMKETYQMIDIPPPKAGGSGFVQPKFFGDN